MDFQDQDTKQAKNPFNYNVLKGGKVDPKSKLYQRSVEGREKLSEMLSRLWGDGTDEADVFMAGVKALTSRDKGYVGAYLDSKNPGRRYQENEAMAITDQVMKDEGIGNHPGNRLTREKDDEGKAKRKEENVSRGGFGPKQAPGKKAMPVGQQRKEGKREGSGTPVKDTEGWDREGLGQPETGPSSEWQKTLEDRIKGEATTADVVKAFQKEKQSKLSQSPEAQAKRKTKQGDRQADLRQKIAEDKGLKDQEAATAGPEPEEEKPIVSEDQITGLFRNKYNQNKKDALERAKAAARKAGELAPKTAELTADDLEYIAQETADDLGIDLNTTIEAINKKFKLSIGGEEQAATTEPAAAPEPETQAPEEKPTAQPPEAEAPAREVTSKGGFKAPGQAARRGGGGFKPSPRELRAVKEKVANSTPEQIIKEFKQGTLFPSGLTTETSTTNPLEGGSAATIEQPPAPEKGGQEPEGQGDLLDKEGAAKDFTKSGPQEVNQTPRKPTQRSIRGLGPSAGKFDTTRTKKAGDELLTQNLKGYGFKPSDIKQIQKSGLTEQERQKITGRKSKEQEVKESQRTAPEPAEQPSLLTEEGNANDFTKSGPEKKPSPAKNTTPKGKSPLDQVAKAVLSGIERDKAARESAGQFFNRVRDLIQKQAGQGSSKSDVDQAAAKAINQQKGRTTRNKTVNSAEYQEFAQSIRSMIR